MTKEKVLDIVEIGLQISNGAALKITRKHANKPILLCNAIYCWLV